VTAAADDPHPHDDEDDDLAPCYRHPERLTALHCISCERPICTECAVMGAVGQKCPDCARLPRTARATVPFMRVARGAAVGLVLSIVAGYLYWSIPLPIIGWIVAGIVGGGIGELVRRATGGYRGLLVARVALLTVLIGFAWPLVVHYATGSHLGAGSLLNLVGVGLAAFSAWQRAS
jgi:hypothetical protein